MNKELTPMMELIEKLESRRESMRILDEDGLLLKNEFIHKSNEINSIQLLISNMLPKEKQVNSDLEALKNQNRVLRNLNFKYREKLGLSNEPINLDLLTELE